MATALSIDAIKRRPAVKSEPMDPGRVRLDLSVGDFGDPHAAPGYTFVNKLVAKNNGWDHAYAERVAEEFRRFVILWAYYPGVSHVPSQAVDEAWHLAILFTQRYATMCQHYFGRFKHHNPSSSDRERVTLRGGYGHTLAQYEEVFGEEPPSDIWPAPQQSLVAQDCGILDCGRDCESKGCHQGCHAPCHFGGCEGDECG